MEHNWVVGTRTDKAHEQVRQYLNAHPYGCQDENGIDLSLIAANLRLTPDERVRQAQRAAQQLARMFDVRVT
jgi:hypothetical protein